MTDTVILWGHALAALLFCMVAAAQARDAGETLPRRTLVAALLASALWALAVAGIGPQDLAARVFESLRNLAWLGFMYALARRGGPRALALVYLALGGIVLVGTGVAIVEASYPEAAEIFRSSRVALRMMAAAGALVLVNQVFLTLDGARGGQRVILGALGGLWALDLLLYGLAWFGGFDPLPLIAVRGMVAVLLAPLFAVAIHRRGDWTLRVSRAVAWQSLGLAGAAFYLLVMVLASQAIVAVAGDHARVAQTAFIFGGTAALLTLISSPWLRAWAKVMLAKHLFRHRYDYRAEWLRFTDTLGKPDDPAPLAVRVVQATADLTDSPAGLLLVPHEQGMDVAARWNWPDAGAGTGPLLAQRLADGRIIELDGVRGPAADPDEAAAVPQWMLDGEGGAAAGWALVPLMHFDRLQGAILLARPPVPRALDWEDFDLLRLAGRQVASYLAEATAQEALSEAQRFDEFNRRFAFILHDIKNLVSQLSLLARNAERHADNPDFRADMIATLQESAGRMNALLARLSQHHQARAEPPVALDLAGLAERVAARVRVQHPVIVSIATPATALADAARLEQATLQLVLNAAQASASADPVTILVRAEGARAIVEVIDSGCGMSLAFVREKLFKPFLSTKPEGFGIGAFEARQLVHAMDGTLEVDSREGEGTRFRIALPAAQHILPRAA